MRRVSVATADPQFRAPAVSGRWLMTVERAFGSRQLTSPPYDDSDVDNHSELTDNLSVDNSEERVYRVDRGPEHDFESVGSILLRIRR